MACQRRALLGMSQTALGDAVGLTFQQVQKYERGSNRISASRLGEFANVLDVPVSFFFDELPGSAVAGHLGRRGKSAREGATPFEHERDPLIKRARRSNWCAPTTRSKEPMVRKRLFEAVKALDAASAEAVTAASNKEAEVWVRLGSTPPSVERVGRVRG